MSDISKEELKKEIAAVLKDADLASITSKKVRQEIEKKLDIDLASRRKEVDELVMEFIDNDKSKSKKNGNVEDDDDDEEEEENEEEDEEDEEEEEEKKPKRSAPKKAAPAKRKAASSDESEDASDDEGDDEYSPKKKTAKKGAAKRGGRKKKGGSDDDSDEDWGKGKKKRASGAKKAPGAKRGGGGYTKAVNLSPELAALVGEDCMPRHEVVKRIWALIKERNLYDPKNKQFAICDDELFKVIGVKRFRTFGMMKFLKNHFVD